LQRRRIVGGEEVENLVPPQVSLLAPRCDAPVGQCIQLFERPANDLARRIPTSIKRLIARSLATSAAEYCRSPLSSREGF
jgi:hypothetical protein